MILLRSREETSISAILLLITCFIQDVAIEYCFKEYIQEFEFIKQEDGDFFSVPNIKYEKAIEVYKSLYK